MAVLFFVMLLNFKITDTERSFQILIPLLLAALFPELLFDHDPDFAVFR